MYVFEKLKEIIEKKKEVQLLLMQMGYSPNDASEHVLDALVCARKAYELNQINVEQYDELYNMVNDFCDSYLWKR